MNLILAATLSARLCGPPGHGVGIGSAACIVSGGPPALQVAILRSPVVLAGYGGIGIPKVIAWNDTTGASGIAWAATASITAANPSITYNGTSTILNLPTGKSLEFDVNAAKVLNFSLIGGNLVYDGSNGGSSNFRAASNGAYNFANGSVNYWSLNNGVANTGARLQAVQADGASSVSTMIDHSTAFATAGAKDVQISDNGVEKFAFKWDSGLTFSNTIAPAAADNGIGADASGDLILNTKSAKFIGFTVNGVSQATISATALAFANGTNTISSTGALTYNAATGNAHNFQVNGVTQASFGTTYTLGANGEAFKTQWTNGSAGTAFSLASIATGTCSAVLTVTITGAANGDPCVMNQGPGSPGGGFLNFCQGNGANQARVWWCNLTGSTNSETVTAELVGWDPN